MDGATSTIEGVFSAYDLLRILIEIIVPAAVYAIAEASRLRRFMRLQLSDVYKYLPFSILYLSMIRLIAMIPCDGQAWISDSAYRALIYGDHWTNIHDVAYTIATLYVLPWLFAQYRTKRSFSGKAPMLDDGWELWIESVQQQQAAWAVVTMQSGRRIGISIDNGLTYSPDVRVLRASKVFEILDTPDWVGKRLETTDEVLIAVDVVESIMVVGRR